MLFESIVDQDEAYIENFEVIIQAIENANTALSIYEARDDGMEMMEPNNYGIALCHYTLGYIYHKFAPQLCDERVEALGKFGDFMRYDEIACLEDAEKHYGLAADSFNVVQHKMGEYLSCKRKLEVLKRIAD